jgi:hypothetical protein
VRLSCRRQLIVIGILRLRIGFALLADATLRMTSQ